MIWFIRVFAKFEITHECQSKNILRLLYVTVHKLCRLDKGGEKGSKIVEFTFLVKRRQSREEGQKSPILRRHSLWTAPISISHIIPIIYAIKVLLAKLWNPDVKWSKSHKNIKIWHLHTKDSLSILVEQLTRVHFVIKAYVLRSKFTT